jgi:quercetin dioxygenase-like cupin family protein/alkylhydroperoxidase/carboxymuconolactone decarboxylase family protein YurZ
MNRYLIIPIAAIACCTGIAVANESTADSLNDRQKAIVCIAAFTSSGNLQELETALGNGLDSGLTINEIREILVHIYAYAGFPRALNGINTFIRVLETRKEQGIEDVTGREATPVPPDFDRQAYGHSIRNNLAGRDMSIGKSGYAEFAPIIDQFLVEHLFADVFYRDILNHQERELVTISVLASLPGVEPQLKSHIEIAMRTGLSQAQLEGYVAVLKQEVGGESAGRAASTLGALVGSPAPATPLESIAVTRGGQLVKGSPENFSGNVTVESRFSSKSSDSYSGAMVNFEAGARTAWHTHPLGQTLVVISGRGLVQSEGGPLQEILPGDVVWIPGNQRHWHGAAPDSPMSHIAISTPSNGSTVKWMEQVEL